MGITRNNKTGWIYRDDNIIFNHSCHEMVYPEDFNCEPHTHEVCELLFLTKGAPKYIVEGKEYKLSPNTLIISRPGDRHMIFFEEKGIYHRYNLLLDEKQLPFDFAKTIPSSLDIINFDGNSIVCDLFKKTDYYFEHFNEHELSYLLRSISEEIFFNIAIAVKEDYVQGGSATSNPIISKAIAYINENLVEISDLDYLCDKLYITKSHLHHLFIKHLKISPKKYILSKRLSRARQAIRSGKKPCQVYIENGFSDYSTFYRDYKNFFGHSPSKENEFDIEVEL